MKTEKEWLSLGFFVRSREKATNGKFSYSQVAVRLCGPTKKTYEYWKSLDTPPKTT